MPTEHIRIISCRCGSIEELPVDEQRWHAMYFTWLSNVEREALYKCLICSETTHSYSIVECSPHESLAYCNLCENDFSPTQGASPKAHPELWLCFDCNLE
jgi:hypothetical protein